MSRAATSASRIAGPSGQAERLPALAAELAALKVSVIVTLGNTQAVRAADYDAASIPIVFMLGTDPVELGFIASFAHPGGNLTGVFNLNQQLAQKWLEVLHEIVPAATTFALLVNPTNPATTMRYTEAMQAAAQKPGLRIHVVQASADRDFDPAFANVREHRAGALAIAADALFISRVDQLAALGLHHAVPALYPFREFAAAGAASASYGSRSRRHLSLGRALHRPYSEWREAGRSAGAAGHQGRARPQPENRQGARPDLASDASSPVPTRSSNEPAGGPGGCRRGHRVRRRASGER